MKSEENSAYIRKAVLALSSVFFFFMVCNLSLVSFAVAFICTLIFIVVVLKFPNNLLKSPRWYAYVVALPITLFSGNIFYENWQGSDKLTVIASILRMPLNTFLFIITVFGCIFIEYFSANIFSMLYSAFKSEKSKNNLNLWKNNDTPPVIDYIDLIVGLVITLFISFQFFTFPFSKNYPSTDSSVFIYIGKQMHNGLIPYKDLFDHKGLLIYFYQYLGWCISDKSYIGVWFIELVNMFATVLIGIMVIKLFVNKRLLSYISIITVFIISGIKTISGGNLTEEYALPWIMLALYICLKYIKTDKFKIWEIGLLGISFVAVLMLRVNMISVWMAFMPIIFVKMIVKREWKDLGRATIGFIVGTAVALIPFALYLIFTGSTKDMIDYYIKFNLSYSNNVTSLSSRLITAKYFIELLGWICGFSCLFILFGFYKNKVLISSLWFFAVSFVLINLSGYNYQHYAIIMIPALIIPIALFLYGIYAVVLNLKTEFSGKPILIFIKRFSAVAVCPILLFVMTYLYFNSIKDIESPHTDMLLFIKNETNKEDDVLIVGNDCVYYLETDRSTKNKFFYQYPPVNYSDDLYKEFYELYQNKKPDYVIVRKYTVDTNDETTNIYDFLKKISNKQIGEGKMESFEEYENFYVLKNNTGG